MSTSSDSFVTQRDTSPRIARIDGLDLRVGDTFRYYDGYLGHYVYQTITAITLSEGQCGDYGTWHCQSGAGITRHSGECELVVA